MNRGKKITGGVYILGPALIVGIIAQGCGGGDVAGTQVKDVDPEVRQQIQQTISKGYSQDYNAKYKAAKKR